MRALDYQRDDSFLLDSLQYLYWTSEHEEEEEAERRFALDKERKISAQN